MLLSAQPLGSVLGMKLYELAYCCRLYGHLTGYDRHLSQLHQRVGSGLDPLIPAHRTALFQWLNGWGCRQFAREHMPPRPPTEVTRAAIRP